MARHIEDLIERQLKRWNSMAQALRRPTVQPCPPETTPGRLHPPLCISRAMGAGARAIVARLAERLGYQIFGSMIIDEIARDLNVQRRLVDSLDECGRGELETLLETALRGRELSTEEYFASLVRVVETLALQGGVILLGRGASFIVGERAALRALITAPLDVRVARVMAYEQLDAQTARERVLESDRRREQFVRRYWKADVNDPVHYDLSINTERLTPDDAAALILEALRRRGLEPERLAMSAPAAEKAAG